MQKILSHFCLARWITSLSAERQSILPKRNLSSGVSGWGPKAQHLQKIMIGAPFLCSKKDPTSACVVWAGEAICQRASCPRVSGESSCLARHRHFQVTVCGVGFCHSQDMSKGVTQGVFWSAAPTGWSGSLWVQEAPRCWETQVIVGVLCPPRSVRTCVCHQLRILCFRNTMCNIFVSNGM